MRRLSIRRLIIPTHVLLLCGLVWIGIVSPWSWQADRWFYVLSVFIVILFVWAVWSWTKVGRSLFDPYILFLAAATLFNGGHALLEVLNLNADGILRGAFSARTVAQSLYAVAIGIAALHLGALLGVWNRKAGNNGPDVAPPDGSAREDQACRLVGWFLFAIAIVPTLLLLRQAIAVVMSSGYFGLYQQQQATSFAALPRVLSAFLMPSAMFLLAGSRHRLSGRVVSALIVVGFAGIQFFLGSRMYAAMPLIAYAWLWHRRVARLPASLLLSAGAVTLFLIFPLVSFTRMAPGADRSSILTLWSTLTQMGNPIVTIVSQMGDSMRTIAYTMDLVPVARPYDGGESYLFGLLTVFPNLFWPVHPTVAHGMAADWLVRTVAPEYAAAGGGFGYSFLAEAYLNFGWPGLVLVPAVVGYLLVKFVQWAQQSDHGGRLAAAASFASLFLLFARGEFGSMSRMLVWYALLPSLLVLFVCAVGAGRRTQEHEHD